MTFAISCLNDICNHILEQHLQSHIGMTSAITYWNDVCNHILEWHLQSYIWMTSAIAYWNDVCNHILEWHLQSHIGMTSADVTWICIMYYIFQVLLEARRLVRSHSRTYRAKYSPDLGVLQPGYRTWQELVQSLAYVGPYELWGCLVL